MRQALHDGRLRGVLIFFASLAVASTFESSQQQAVAACAVFTASWILCTHLVERSLSTVKVVAGRLGVAALSALTGLAVAGGASFWLPGMGNRREVMVLALLVFCIVLGTEAAKSRLAVLRSRILLVGREGTSELVDLLARHDRIPFTAIGVVDDDREPALPVAGAPVLGSVGELQRIVEETMPDLVVVAVDRGRPEVFSGLGNVASLGFRVVGLPEFYEHAFGRVPVRRMTDAWFMSILHLYQRSYSRWSKRAFDILGATAGLLLTAPLFPLIAIFVRQSEGPIFYRQTRLGEQGRLFTIFKFRTMRVDAESNGAVWAQESDPRMTSVGRLLRATRLDELPQLINVLRGEMSMVGPRPERPEFVQLLEESIPFWSRRHLLRPGITGWAQLRAGYAADSLATEEKLSYDLWYLRHQSLIVDALICARTVPSLFLAAGR
jgi:exopolysaccharide biosynthesis polyprenyl glycosylphosphotransferase